MHLKHLHHQSGNKQSLIPDSWSKLPPVNDPANIPLPPEKPVTPSVLFSQVAASPAKAPDAADVLQKAPITNPYLLPPVEPPDAAGDSPEVTPKAIRKILDSVPPTYQFPFTSSVPDFIINHISEKHNFDISFWTVEDDIKLDKVWKACQILEPPIEGEDSSTYAERVKSFLTS